MENNTKDLQDSKKRLLSKFEELKNYVEDPNSTDGKSSFLSIGVFVQKVNEFVEEAENYSKKDDSFHIEHILSVLNKEVWYIANDQGKGKKLKKHQNSLLVKMLEAIHQFDLVMCTIK